ncbi:hypothetical protein RJ639_029388 [Escallonia herrerae]|uniref:Uncharacterized protein n=1 Tax=Escallonia herrerae TaxID=1293975 RepID=A0AA89BKK6_9ASTE|nr:hypothetical protein RJ639_029388 [Escallonia herrerae]
MEQKGRNEKQQQGTTAARNGQQQHLGQNRGSSEPQQLVVPFPDIEDIHWKPSQLASQQLQSSPVPMVGNIAPPFTTLYGFPASLQIHMAVKNFKKFKFSSPYKNAAIPPDLKIENSATKTRTVAILATGSIKLIRAPILSSHRLTQIMATNTTVVNSDNTVSNTTVVQFNPASQLPIKLAGSQFHNLESTDGTLAAPPTTLTENNQSTPNPAYQIWFRQDQLVQNAILASVEPTLASTVAIAPSAHKAWTSLHTAFANKSQTRIISLQDQLARITKDSRPVTDYLRDIRSIADELATAGAAITNVQLIVRILQGLGSEYKAISAAIRSRETTISYEELYEKLLDHELFLKHEETKQTTPITVAMAQRNNQQPSSYNNNRRQSNNNSQGSQPWRNQSARDQSNPSQWRRRNQQQQTKDNPLRCQLCDRPGHSAKITHSIHCTQRTTPGVSTPISWCSKKQRSVSRSSTEAEYRAVAAALAETNWLTNLLRELRFPLKAIPRILCDNVGTTYICENPVFHSKMKHIAIDFHFVRDQVQRKEVEVKHLHSADQVADVLTKPLPRASFSLGIRARIVYPVEMASDGADSSLNPHVALTQGMDTLEGSVHEVSQTLADLRREVAAMNVRQDGNPRHNQEAPRAYARGGLHFDQQLRRNQHRQPPVQHGPERDDSDVEREGE